MKNPFVGPRPLRRREAAQLYGRRREVEELFHLLAAERVVWLYSPSGAGKTSLVEAGLIPRLEAESFHVWPVIRIHALAGEGPCNRYVGSVLASLGESLPEEEPAPGALAERITGRRRSIDEQACVALVFDQFEEILTLDPLDEDGRRQFFEELEKVFEDPYVWALFVLREEHWAALGPYIGELTGRRIQTVRLELLDRSAALEAMVQTVRATGKELPSADLLVDDLATVRVLQADGSLSSRPGRFVEPVYLQVVCRRLWQATPRDEPCIRFEPLAEVGDVDGVLVSFFDQELAQVAASRGFPEHALRRWVADHLMTPGGLRVQVLREGTSCAGLDSKIVEALCGVHLLRAERRAGRTWYELAHDRLVEPVRQANAAWFEDHLAETQRRVLLWVEGGYSADMLLIGETLERAEAWAAQPGQAITETERRFLFESRRGEDMRRRQERQTQRIRRLGQLAMAIGGLAFAIAVVAGWGWQRAIAARGDVQRGLARVYERDGLRYGEAGDLGRAQAFLAESLRLDPDHLMTRFRLSESFASITGVTPLEPLQHPQPIGGATFSRDGRWIASAAGDQLLLWHAATGMRVWSRVHVGIQNLAFTADGSDLLVASSDGSIDRYEDWQTGPRRRPWQRLGDAYKKSVFSPDGRWILAINQQGQAHLVNLVSGESSGWLPEDGAGLIAAAFDGGGRILATGTQEGRIRLWDLHSGRELLDLQTETGAVYGLALDVSGEFLAATLEGAGVQVWRTTGEPVGTPFKTEFGFRAVAMGPHAGTVVAAKIGKGAVELWDWRRGRRLEVLAQHRDEVVRLQVSPDRRRLLSASRDQRLSVWSPAQPMFPAAVLRPRDGASMARFNSDGRLLVSLSNDRRVLQVWDAVRRRELGDPLGLEEEAVDMAFRSAGDRLWVSLPSRRGQLWDWRRGVLEKDFVGDDSLVPSVDEAASRSDGVVDWGLRRLDDSRIQVVHLASKRPVEGLLTHGRKMLWAELSPGGELVVTASADGTARLWHTATGQPKGESLEHGGSWVKTATFSPQGRWVITAAEDGLVRFWETASGQPAGRPLEHDQPLRSAFFDAQGKQVVTVCDDGVVRIWKVELSADLGDAEWLAKLGQAVAGRRVNDAGALEPIAPCERFQMLVELSRHSQFSGSETRLLNDFADSAPMNCQSLGR